MKLALRDAHEDDVWQWLGSAILFVLVCVSKGSKNDVGLQVIEDLVVTEVREFGEIQDWLLLGFFIILVVVDFNETLSNEVHLLDITLVADNSLSWSVDSAVHSNNELVSETSFTLLKEMVERSLELLEHSSILD